MRKVKYRAFNRHTGKMLDSDIFHDRVNFTRYADQDGTELRSEDHIILMQFTGALDIKGKEIYEGDIIRIGTKENCTSGYGETIRFIEWDNDRCHFRTSALEIRTGWFPNIRKDDSLFFEVIGNIHEDYHLLD